MSNDGISKEKSANGHVLGVEELKGYYYSHGDLQQVDHHIRTTKRIGDYVAQRFTKEIGTLVEKGTEAKFEEPADPGKDAGRLAARLHITQDSPIGAEALGEQECG